MNSLQSLATLNSSVKLCFIVFFLAKYHSLYQHKAHEFSSYKLISAESHGLLFSSQNPMSACDLVQIIAIFNFVRISVLYNQHTNTITNTIIITISTAVLSLVGDSTIICIPRKSFLTHIMTSKGTHIESEDFWTFLTILGKLRASFRETNTFTGTFVHPGDQVGAKVHLHQKKNGLS